MVLLPAPPHRRRALSRAATALAVVLVGLLAACGGDGGGEGPVPILLVSVDTLRFDHVTCYGYPKPTTPVLARTLCRDGVVFEQAISHAPSTLPSHASMLTGLLPVRHGASLARKQGLAPEITTVAEILAQHGYRTASFNDGGQVSANWGLDQGFDVYRSVNRDSLERNAEAALEWIDQALAEGTRDRLFLFVHTYEPHHPYKPAEEDLALFDEAGYDGYLGRSVGYQELERINKKVAPLELADLEFVRAAYDAEIHAADRGLGLLLAGLEKRHLYERALIVFTSDHGEEMNERGFVGWHAHTLYDELLRVPLVVKLPGNRGAGTRVPYQVRLADLAPTFLAAAGLEPPPGLDGESLLPLVDGPPEGRRLVVSQKDGQDESAIRSSRWKLYEERLFDLGSDPRERFDAAPAHPEVRDALRSRLDQALAERREGSSAELSEETLDRLRALGYL